MNIVILGATGTLGRETLCQIVGHRDYDSITCFSRDELKQQELKKSFPELRYVIGDIRDRHALRQVITSTTDVVFHFSALKHVDVLEANPEEAIKTNVLGTIHGAEEAMLAGVPYYVFSSTDKAVLPINTYGMTKAIAERYLLGLNGKQEETLFSVYRWGNVLGSRGSAIPYFVDCIRQKKPIGLTHQDMSRFWIPISEAVAFMLESFEDEESPGEIKIPQMRAATVARVINRLYAKLAPEQVKQVNITGIRPGEKIHECIYSSHDYCVRSDNCKQYTDEELDQLLEPFL